MRITEVIPLFVTVDSKWKHIFSVLVQDLINVKMRAQTMYMVYNTTPGVQGVPLIIKS